jgi:hypothetical protein
MRSLSATLNRLSRRERVVVAAGTAVSLVAVLVVLVVLPGVGRWRDREAQIVLRAEQLARLQALIEREAMIRERRGSLEQARAVAGRRLLEGETAAVAASNLQVLLNRYATESRLVLDRVDAVTRRQGGHGIVEIPARIAARGDVFGLVDLLFYLQHGEKLLVIDDLRVDNARGAVSGDQLLTMSVSLHGYHRSTEGQP